jgi:hypothetical protein
MAIERHHLLFAAKQSVGWLVFFIAIAAGFVALRGGTLIDFAWGASAGVIWSVGYFLYRLWRTQQRL